MEDFRQAYFRNYNYMYKSNLAQLVNLWQIYCLHHSQFMITKTIRNTERKCQNYSQVLYTSPKTPFYHGVQQQLHIQGLSRFKMVACTWGIGSMSTKHEARSSQSNSDKSASLMYCEATLEVRLTFCAVEKFRYKNLLSFFFFFIRHNLLTKA